MKLTMKIFGIICLLIASVVFSVDCSADYIKTENGIKYKYSDDNKIIDLYTGWASSSKGKMYYIDGVKVKEDTVINGIRYKFSSSGYLKGKYTGWIDTEHGKRYYKNGKLIKSKWLKTSKGYLYAGIKGDIIIENLPEKLPPLEEVSESESLKIAEAFLKGQGSSVSYAKNYRVKANLGTYGERKVFLLGSKKPKHFDDSSDYKIEYQYFGGYFFTNVHDYAFPVIVLDDYKFENLYYAYSDGRISDDVMARINYYLQSHLAAIGVKDNEENEPKYPALKSIDENKQQKLLKDFIKYKNDIGERWSDSELENMYIVKYYGTYHNREVVTIWNSEIETTDDQKVIEVGGQRIILSSGCYDVLLHKNGSYVDITKAYQKGYLNDEDIKKISYYAKN